MKCFRVVTGDENGRGAVHIVKVNEPINKLWNGIDKRDEEKNTKPNCAYGLRLGYRYRGRSYARKVGHRPETFAFPPPRSRRFSGENRYPPFTFASSAEIARPISPSTSLVCFRCRAVVKTNARSPGSRQWGAWRRPGNGRTGRDGAVTSNSRVGGAGGR